MRAAHAIFVFIIQSQLFLALGAAALTAMATLLMQQQINPLYSLLAFFYVLSMHVLNKYLGLPRDRSLLFGAYKYFSHYQRLFLSLAVACLLLSLVISFTLGIAAFVLMLLSMLLGAVYSFAIVPSLLARFLRYRRLMDIPGSKDLFMAAAWTVVVVLVPFLESSPLPSVILSDAKNLQHILASFSGFLLTGLFVFVLVLTRAIIFDVRDIEGDIVLGRETIPIILGRERVLRMLRLFLAAALLIPLVGFVARLFPALALWEEAIVLYVALLCGVPISQAIYQSVAYDALIDAQFLLAGVIALGWLALR
jgi:4-hydroxybenzoate polyprenyltransferase